jgi:hypothetical protein
MQDDQIDDLKQFIASTVSQTEQRLTERIDKMDVHLDSLEKKVEDGFSGVGEAIAEINDSMEKRNTEVNDRLTNLESAQA